MLLSTTKDLAMLSTLQGIRMIPCICACVKSLYEDVRNAVCMAVTVRFRAQVTVETAHVIYKTERAFNVNQDGLECIVILLVTGIITAKTVPCHAL